MIYWGTADIEAISLRRFYISRLRLKNDDFMSFKAPIFLLLIIVITVYMNTKAVQPVVQVYTGAHHTMTVMEHIATLRSTV